MAAKKKYKLVVIPQDLRGREVVKTQIRLPADLHRFIQGCAIENDVSMNAMMVYLLKQACEAP